ncbi:tripartite tricarboxylate transporter substrate binding protein [Bordetella sp. BOR01]|uniref:Bug family tripartite tricarboxylate transporter substrate binding protein n=1 Tax=Bordetella sp. BOR01 TaxID=2854779 RepID=UPI001C44BA1D|nr:tripartite tricarboxylate transporter substrate binding protein [Bordetella sp. BOR01]MBV7484650.1 tripartite tricarboxylate transporter substrate binding protein [Bordetella sp. BOR01]
MYTLLKRIGAPMVLAGATLALPGMQAAAAETYPNRPVTLVSPYLAGGAADTIVRSIASAAARQLGQPVVVESKPGAEGLIGSTDVMRAQPDGYRLLWGGAGSMMIVPALRNNPPFDPVKAFTPVAGSVDFSFFLYTPADFPANNMAEFMQEVKKNPNKYNYGTGNNQGRLTFAYMNKEYGLEMQHVAYRGETAVINDLLPGRVQAFFGTTAALPYVKEGKIKALVTTLPERTPLMPDVPTMKESGLSEVPFSPGGGWLGIFGPAGMDASIVAPLHKAFSAAFEDEDVKQKMYQAGLSYTPMTVPELTEFVRTQRDQYIHAVKDLGIPKTD